MTPENAEFWFGGIFLFVCIIIWSFYFGSFMDDGGYTSGFAIFEMGSKSKAIMIAGASMFLFWISYTWIQYQRNYVDVKLILSNAIDGVDGHERQPQGSTLPVLTSDM